MLLAPARAQCTVILLLVAAVALPALVSAQSETERGENSWKNAAALALQGKVEASLNAFAEARKAGETLHDSVLIAAALRGAAEVNSVYRGCRDTSLALLRQAVGVSIAGDRVAGQLMVRQLAAVGKLGEARTALKALYGDAENVPRSISHESVSYLSALAAIERAAGQPAAALSTLKTARTIADRLASGDVIDSAARIPLTQINSVNYWVTFEMAQLMLTTHSRNASTSGKELMDALARSTDEPEEGNERRFNAFRLADRLRMNAWRCVLNGEKCPVPLPARCP